MIIGMKKKKKKILRTGHNHGTQLWTNDTKQHSTENQTMERQPWDLLGTHLQHSIVTVNVL